MNWALTTPRNRRKDPSATSACTVSPSPCWRGSGSALPCIRFNADSPIAGERGWVELHICWAWADTPWQDLLVKILLYPDSIALLRRRRHFTCSFTWTWLSWEQATQLFPFGRARVREALGLFLKPSKLLHSRGFCSGRNFPSRSSLGSALLVSEFLFRHQVSREPPRAAQFKVAAPPASSACVTLYPCPALFFTRDLTTTWHVILSHLFMVHPQ